MRLFETPNLFTKTTVSITLQTGIGGQNLLTNLLNRSDSDTRRKAFIGTELTDLADYDTCMATTVDHSTPFNLTLVILAS